MSIFSRIFGGDASQYFLKQNKQILEEINQTEAEIEKLSDIGLREKSLELKTQIKSKEDLDKILVTAFSLCREAGRRTLKQRHYDMQLLGGLALHQGKIAEMRTGEGKTLAATAPAYLNALLGKGVHIVTVNDYLAKRDAVWMGQIYYALGLSVSCILHESAFVYDPSFKQGPKSETRNSNENTNSNELNEQKPDERDIIGGFRVVEDYLRPVARKEAYQADITYGTNHEFGFDYLRDNLVYDLDSRVQRGHYFCIVDEVDSILIDEARTPLIITVPEAESSEYYKLFAKIVPNLKLEEDYNLDEKLRSVTLTEEGIHKVENILQIENIYSPEGFRYLHYLEESLKAYVLFHKDKEYVVKDGEILIVDEFTGRMLMGRRYSNGLHQAIEAKEGVDVKQENRILASITFQNYFRLYEKLSGMTGTALTSSEEFDKVYKLEVASIPTNKPMIRKDLPDLIYKTEEEKWKAIIAEIKNRNAQGQPVLVGTVSIQNNEKLAAMLNREGINYEILNAKNHEREGAIIAQAGKLNAVTVATNMAGRGVDIILGGNPPELEEAEKIKQIGGLHVLGTERHDARRIDNQLRGRAGRQGDQGSSQFFLSLEDNLMRIFGGGKLKSLMERLNFPEGMPIESKFVSRAIESAQSRVEGFHFDARNHTLEYDDVLNKHRSTFYRKRDEALNEASKEGLKDFALDIIGRGLGNIINLSNEEIKKAFVLMGILEESFNLDEISEEDRYNVLLEKSQSAFQKMESEMGKELFDISLKMLILRIYDALWTEHLENMENLRESVGIRAYGQHDPLVEYKSSGHQLFKDFFNRFESIFFEGVFKMKKPVLDVAGVPNRNINITPKAGLPIITSAKTGRNDPCPCGSGKKYKKCCGK
jgi:preprotein translocase subunit SecA